MRIAHVLYDRRRSSIIHATPHARAAVDLSRWMHKQTHTPIRRNTTAAAAKTQSRQQLNKLSRIIVPTTDRGGSVAEWLACWTQAQKGPGSNRGRDAVG